MKKTIFVIILIMLLVGCNQSKPQNTIDKFDKYVEYREFGLIYDEILDSEVKNISTREMFIEVAKGLFVNGYINIKSECVEISNDGKNAKLFCNIRYKTVYGVEIEDRISYNLIKEDGSWKLKLG